MRRLDDPTTLILGAAMIRGPHITLTRDLVAFSVGVIILLNEVVSGSDRPNLIYAGAGLIALSAWGRGMNEMGKKDGPGD